MSLKRVLALGLAMVMVFALFAGCKKTEDPANNNNNNQATEDPKNPADGKKIRTDLVFAEPSDIVTLDPPESTDSYSNKAINIIFDTLVDLDENSEFIPGLAESWEDKDGMEIIFHLRKGVKFHNGEELKASDVKFTMERVAANPKSKNMVAQVTSFDVIDDYTISFKMSEPFAPIYVNLTEGACHIVNEKAVKEAGADVNKKPVGTGAMKLEYWRVNDEAKLVRFDEHWAGKPVTTSIRLRVIPESNSRTIALENGEVDTVTPVAAVDIERIKNNPKLAYNEMEASSVIYLSPNQNKEPFNNKLVRQAMHYATDKQSIIDVVYEGYALPGVSPFPTIMPSFDETLKGKYTFDLEKAKALLTEAGYPNGFKAEVCVSSDERNRAAQVLQSDYAKIGIELDINVMEFGTLMDYCNTGTHDMFIMGWGHATNQDRTMTNNFHSSSIGPTGNRSWYNNPEVDKLIEEGRRTMEWTEREKIYKQLQNIIMEDCAWIPLWQQINIDAYNANLKDVIWFKRSGGYYTNAYVVEE